MRGKVTIISTALKSMGITPACAGKRPRAASRPAILQDHPRVCGEKFACIVLIYRPMGSPPRVRGKVTKKIFIGLGRRITPACAGKSVTKIARPEVCKDHPRVCGEKPIRFGCLVWGGGSPPRVRGKVLAVLPLVNELRITPACAGKRLVGYECPVPVWDHPRVCGEKKR